MLPLAYLTLAFMPPCHYAMSFFLHHHHDYHIDAIDILVTFLYCPPFPPRCLHLPVHTTPISDALPPAMHEHFFLRQLSLRYATVCRHAAAACYLIHCIAVFAAAFADAAACYALYLHCHAFEFDAADYATLCLIFADTLMPPLIDAADAYYARYALLIRHMPLAMSATYAEAPHVSITHVAYEIRCRHTPCCCC